MATQNFESFHLTDIKDKIDGKSPLLGALFLFFLFFFTFLFVYFLYTCIHRRGGGDSNAPPARGTGLDSAAISSLPVLSYGSIYKKPSPGAECAICLSVFQEGDSVKVLPICRHGFHPGCVDKWLRSRSSCPLCRACVNPSCSVSREVGSEIP
ncbi:hypothetical protein CASFOL_032005 [Castilleja foliolosa]|uniref:RING-type E3 ubiquitin transferase n=1 Tax=Castilleja foliolosa TaxID=1961234 RepID=A0ABD3C0U8_9LAMI